VGNTYGGKTLTMRAVNKILKQAGKNSDDWRKFNLKKSFQAAALAAAVTTEVVTDYKICIKSLALDHYTSVGTIFFHSIQGP
jgi:hypothetical protein